MGRTSERFPEDLIAAACDAYTGAGGPPDVEPAAMAAAIECAFAWPLAGLVNYRRAASPNQAAGLWSARPDPQGGQHGRT